MSSLNNIAAQGSLAANIYSSDPAYPQAVQFNDTDSSSATNGSTAGAVDGIYRNVSLSVVSGTPYVLDCTALHDIFGAAITAAHVVAIKICNTGGTGTLTHGGGTSALYGTDPIAIEPGGKFEWEALSHGGTGLPVASGTKNLQITASTGTVTGTITIFTRSA